MTREDLLEFWDRAGGPLRNPVVVGRPSKRSGSGCKALPVV